jgi:hypothetical protein
LSAFNDGWTTVAHKKIGVSDKKKYRNIGKYIPPQIGQKNISGINKHKSPSLKNRSNKIIKDFDNPDKYIHKYLKGSIYYDKDGINLLESNLFNFEHDDLSKKYKKLINSLKELNNKFDVKNIPLIINSIKSIELILEKIRTDLPQSTWADKFYSGSIYNNKGTPINEETPELIKLSNEYMQNKTTVVKKSVISENINSKQVYRKVSKNLSFRDSLGINI